MSERSIGIAGAALTLLALGLQYYLPATGILSTTCLAVGIAMLLWALVRDRPLGKWLLQQRKEYPMPSTLVVMILAAVVFGGSWWFLGIGQTVALQGPASDELTKQRSWVGVDRIGPVDLIPGRAVKIPVAVTNTGNLPAFDVAAFVQNGTSQRPMMASQSLPFDGVVPEPTSTSAIGIQEKRVVTFDVAPFPVEVVEQIKNGTLLWHCYGWISYRDVNLRSGTRRTDFCFVYQPRNETFDYCAGHNTLQ